MMPSKLSPYLRLMRLDKPVGTYLVLLPALGALWLAADGVPPLWVLLVFIAGAFVMRSAGCVINDYADRDWDGAVARTCDRPLACGEVTPKAALRLFFGLVLFGGVLVLTLRSDVLWWAVGAVFLATLYPFTKRWVYYPQLFLGLAFAWAIPMAFVAILGEVPSGGWWLFAATVVWALIYDTWYALVDRDDDLKVGIKSIAVLFGAYIRHAITVLMLLMLLCLWQLGVAFGLGLVWWLTLLAVAAHFVWQQCFKTLAVVNVPESSMVREADMVLLTRAGREMSVASTKGFTTQLVAMMLLVLAIGKAKGNLKEEDAQVLVNELRALPDVLRQVLTKDDEIQQMAQKLALKDNAMFLGRGFMYPIAEEGALKMKELSYIHAEAYPAGELKHGPLALIDEKMPVVSVAPNDVLWAKLKSNLEEVSARGGELFVFSAAGMIDPSEFEHARYHNICLPIQLTSLAPVAYVVPLQLLAYHTAVIRGTDVDQPRNLAKSVTVE